MMNEKWFALGIPQIEKKLKTNAASGLSRKAARSRVNREAGSIFLLPKKSLPLIVADVFADVALIILLLTALISLFFEEFLSGIPVLILTVGYLLVMGYLYYRSQRMTEALEGLFAPTVHVVRGGRLFCVDFRSVAVGDVILVEAGDVLCCDARIVTSDRLRVRMRLDQTQYVSLEKKSDGFVNPKEYRASEMTTMLHAGSVVEQGSARAIVTAVGKYTYLGAMTGGIAYPVEEEAPAVLQRLRKLCGKMNMILLLAVLPFSLISLLMSYINGGTVLLSASFLTALAVAATTMSQMTCRLLRMLYIRQMRGLLAPPNVCAVRSVNAFDQLSAADYVFLTDGCALTDGILHFHAAACAEGEIRGAETANATARYLFELVSLYHTAATGSVTTGISGAGQYGTAFREFIRYYGVDEGALRIRCAVRSYAPGNLSESEEIVCLTDQGRAVYLHVSCSPRAIDQCGFVMFGGERQPLSAEGRASWEQTRKKYAALHQAPMIFSVSFDSLSQEPCLIGMVAFREGVDPNLVQSISRLERMGCRVITFFPKDPSAPRVPEAIFSKGVISKHAFVKNHLPLTFRFGQIRAYADFEAEDIQRLMDHVHAMGKTVLLVGFSEQILSLARQSDGFVTCAPIPVSGVDGGEEELQSQETPGRQYSTSCTQWVKSHARYLIPRPSGGNGGLASLSRAMLRVRAMYANLSSFLCYWIWVQLIRVIITVLPMLFGQMILDARHILFCGCVQDAFALWLFSGRVSVSSSGSHPNYCAARTPKDYFLMDRPMLFASLAACASAFLFPQILAFTGLAEQFLYKTEFFFSCLILLHLTVLLWTRFGMSAREWKQIYRHVPLLLEAVTLLIFLSLCALWLPFGNLFAWESNPLPYFLVSLLPSAVFVTVALLLRRREGRRTSARGA